MLKYAEVDDNCHEESEKSIANLTAVKGWCGRLRMSYEDWRLSCGYKTYHEVGGALKVDHINIGYRLENQSLMYYVKSVFLPNNQATNFWTHFLPLLCFVFRYYKFILRTENSFDPIYYPYYVHASGICIVLLVSSVAHMFCSHSQTTTRCCFAADFAAIYLYGLSFIFPLEYYLCPMQYHCKGPSTMAYYTVMLTFVVFATAVSLYSASKGYKRAPMIRTFLYSVGMGTVVLPCVIRYYIYTIEHEVVKHPSFMIGHDLAFLFFIQVLVFILSGVFYATRFPESYFPDRFDIVGQSHHSFHLSTAIAMYLQSQMLENVLFDINAGIDEGDFFDHHFDISWQATFGTFFASLVIVFAVVGIVCYQMHYKEHKHKKE